MRQKQISRETNKMNEAYVLRSEVTKKAFKDLFGCDAGRFAEVKVYVSQEGYGGMLIGVLKDCGIDVSSFMKTRDGIILRDD